MVHDPANPESDHELRQQSAQVLHFRPRPRADDEAGAAGGGAANHDASGGTADDASDDLAQYEQEQDGDEDSDDRRRMLMNAIAVVVVALLVVTGVWIADTIATMEREQDCVMQGRGNCALIELPPQSAKR